MQISLIGTGRMATGLATALAAAGHTVRIAARDAAKAQALAQAVGHGALAVPLAQAAQAAELIVLALPYGAIAEVLPQVEGLAGQTLVDISNPITPDFQDLLIGHSSSAAEEIQRLVPRAQVVKAFNTLFSPLLAPAARAGQTLQVFVAADDAAAKARVSDMARSIGFEALDAGPLRNSRFLEPVGEMNIHFGFFLGQGTNVAPAWVKVPA